MSSRIFKILNDKDRISISKTNSNIYL